MSTGRNVTREVRKDMADRDKEYKKNACPVQGRRDAFGIYQLIILSD